MDPLTQQPQQPPVQTPVMSAAAPQMPSVQPNPSVVVGGQTTVAPAHKSNKKMLFILLFMILVVVVVGIIGYMYVSSNKTPSTQNQQTYAPTRKTAVTPTPTPEVTVSNSSQLDSAINEVNNTSTSTIESELNQAAIEAKSL